MTEFLTIKQMADILKVSEHTITRYIKAGRIRAIKFGKSRRSPVRIDVNELLRLQQVGYEENMEALRKEFMED